MRRWAHDQEAYQTRGQAAHHLSDPLLGTSARKAAGVVAHFYENYFGYVQGRLTADFNITPPPPYHIKEGIDHVLGGTLLRFCNKYYPQSKGTAIEATVLVALADICPC